MFVNHDVTFDRPPCVPTNHQLFDLVLEWTRHQHLVLLIPSRFLNLKKNNFTSKSARRLAFWKSVQGCEIWRQLYNSLVFRDRSGERRNQRQRGHIVRTYRWKTTFCHFHLIRRTKNAAIKYFSEKPNNKLELFFLPPGRRQLLTTDRKWKFSHCHDVSFGAVLLVLWTWYLNQWMANNWIPVVQQEEDTTTDFSFFGWTVPRILRC